MKKIIMLLSVLCCFAASSAFAIKVTALYSGTLPVSSQSPAERTQVAHQALSQVLVKVSGSNQILNNPKIKARINSATANTLMQEFSYAPAPPALGLTKPYLAQLNFDSEGVDKILREAGAPIWGQSRPLLMMWIEYEVPKHPAEIIGADHDIATIVKQNADRRGIPVIFPAMDVEDLGKVSVNDIVTMAMPKLNDAAKRYTSDAVLVGRVMQDTNGYNTQWKLMIGNDQWGWNITGKTMPDCLAALVDHVGDALAGRYATVVSSVVQSNLDLKVTKVTQSDDFVQVINYIKHLTPVSDVQLMSVTGEEMLLRVSLRGTQESFAQALSVGQKLMAVNGDTKKGLLVYQWNP